MIRGKSHDQVNRQVDLDKPLVKIVTRAREWYMHSIEFHFQDGTIERMGKECSSGAGSMQVIHFKEGIKLIGCVIHCGDYGTYGIQWITEK